jgi:hypothetical protein
VAATCAQEGVEWRGKEEEKEGWEGGRPAMAPAAEEPPAAAGRRGGKREEKIRLLIPCWKVIHSIRANPRRVAI